MILWFDVAEFLNAILHFQMKIEFIDSIKFEKSDRFISGALQWNSSFIALE